MKTRRTFRARGLTLIESMLAMLIVSVLMVAAMRAAGASGLTQYRSAERVRGCTLADGLMAEVMALEYQDPGAASFGLESGESSGTRASWNDIDDANGWSESPPQNRDGSDMPDLSDWKRAVKVEWVNSKNIGQVSASETGAKRITVVVSHADRIVATRVAVRTLAPE